MNKKKLDFANANTQKTNFSVLYFTGIHSGKSSTSKMLKMATDEQYNLVRYFSIFYNMGMSSTSANLATFYPIYDHIFMLQFLKQLNISFEFIESQEKENPSPLSLNFFEII